MHSTLFACVANAEGCVFLALVGISALQSYIIIVFQNFPSLGELPISVSDEVPREAYGGDNEPPPPLPPKMEDSEEAASLLPPKPQPRVGSLKNAPPRPPKTHM